jgi:hypothetical protein
LREDRLECGNLLPLFPRLFITPHSLNHIEFQSVNSGSRFFLADAIRKSGIMPSGGPRRAPREAHPEPVLFTGETLARSTPANIAARQCRGRNSETGGSSWLSLLEGHAVKSNAGRCCSLSALTGCNTLLWYCYALFGTVFGTFRELPASPMALLHTVPGGISAY